ELSDTISGYLFFEKDANGTFKDLGGSGSNYVDGELRYEYSNFPTNFWADSTINPLLTDDKYSGATLIYFSTAINRYGIVLVKDGILYRPDFKVYENEAQRAKGKK